MGFWGNNFNIFGGSKSAAQVASEAEAKDEVAADLLRLNEQVALMMNLDQLLENVAKGDKQKRSEKIYNNFATFRGSVGSHIGLTNKIYRNESIQYIFSELDSSILSSLVPSIELYKVFFPKKEANSNGYAWRVPFDDVPVPYEGKTSPYVEKTIEQILAGDGRMHGVGIKSFRYKYVGTNPAEVNTNIEAEVELFFQDIRDLARRIYFHKDDVNFSKNPPIEPTFDQQKEPAGYSFSYVDLAVDSPMSNGKDSSGIPIYNDKYFRLKVILGYADNDSVIDKLLFDKPDVAEKVKKALKSAKVILYLNPFSHDIQFEENGSVTLKIQFIAAMTTVMNNVNALAISQKLKEVQEKEQEFSANTAAQMQNIDQLKKSYCNMPEEQRQKMIDNEQEKVDELLSTQKNAIETQKNLLYAEVFKVLLGLSTIPYVNPENKPKIYSALFDKFAVGAKQSFRKDEVLENAAQLRIKNLSSVRDKDSLLKSYKVDSITDEDQEDYKFIKAAKTKRELRLQDNGQWLYVDVPLDEDLAKQNEKLAEELQKSERTKFTDTDGKYLVKFVFFGDLIDIFASAINTLDTNNKPRIILNNFTLEIPKTASGELISKELSDPTLSPFNTDAEYVKLDLNIADIPISLGMLNSFITQRIIKPRRTSYPLSTLINDLMTDVVSPAVSPAVFGRKTVLNKSIRLSSLQISVPFKNNGTIDAVTGQSVNRFNGNLDETKLQALNIHDSAIQNIESDFGNYYIIYCSNELPKKVFEANGDYDKDTRNGIYHFFIGLDRGLIKKITFSKQDIPFNKEAQFKSSTGDKSLARIKEVYDANIIMFGNNIYRPGDFIYVEPLFFAKNPSTTQIALNIQNNIGLGGYYQVLDVTTTINENIFETTLRTALAGHINEQGKVQQAETGNGGC